MNRILQRFLVALLPAATLSEAWAQAPAAPPPALRGSLAYAAGDAFIVRDLESGGTVEIPAQDVGEPHDNTGGVQPLRFSPDGRRLAVRVWKGGDRIYVLEEGLRKATWVTTGLLTETEGGTTFYWNHLDVAWSPDGRRLAVSSQRAGEARVSAWDGESLRTLHKSTPPEHATDPYRMSWSADGETLYVVPPRGPEPNKLIGVPFSKGEAVCLYRGPEKNPFTALAWDPARKTLAVAAGTSIVLCGEAGEAAPKPVSRVGEAPPKPAAKAGEAALSPVSRVGQAPPKPGAKAGEATLRPVLRAGEAIRKRVSRVGQAPPKSGAEAGEGPPKPVSGTGEGQPKPTAEAGAKEIWTAPAHLRAISWSPDGLRLAGIDWNGGIYVVGRDGGGAWAVTESTGDKWFAPNAAWIGPAKFAFVLVTRAGGAGLYLADAEARSVTRLPVEDVVATDLAPVPGRAAFTFLRVSHRGDWESHPESKQEFRTRAIRADLHVYDATDGSIRPVPSAATIPGEETEGDFSVYLYPVLHIR